MTLARFSVGQAVRTPFGKGIVRDVRNNGSLLVDVSGRALVIHARDVAPLEESGGRSRRTGASGTASADHTSRDTARTPARTGARRGVRTIEIDLHGLTPDAALARVAQAVDDALLDDVDELRVVHGRGSGRLRAIVHRALHQLPVRSVRVDPHNAGVTIVTF